jgi:hypothetical protein
MNYRVGMSLGGTLGTTNLVLLPQKSDFSSGVLASTFQKMANSRLQSV